MIPVYSNTKIYLACSANFATGGPEALHQLGHHLNKLGFNAFMYYENGDKIIDPVHPFYKIYNVPFVKEIENNESNILILPETSLDALFNTKLNKIRKIIWWLSVTNYYIIIKPKIRRAKRKLLYWLRKLYNPVQFATFSTIKKLSIPNIGHSYFSMINLKKNGIEPIGQISDYMNQSFFNQIDSSVIKEDIIVYNPKKNGNFLEEIIVLTPHLKWIPLTDLTPNEVAAVMNRAKLYIDFGYHPGKERMPREACIMKCCMIIGKDGSARYYEDMPIPDKFRFEKDRALIPDIIKTIEECLNAYSLEVDNFKHYRNTLFDEENAFATDIQKIFKWA